MSINYTANNNPFNIVPGNSFPVVNAQRDPTITDNFYPLNTEWKNTISGDVFKFIKNNIVSGVAQADWVQFASGISPANVQVLTGNSGGDVSPDADGRINILGTSGQISVVGTPGTNTLTLSLTGGSTAIDSFVPDTGTNPVVPTALGAVTMVGGNGIQTTGGTNQLTFDMQSPFTGSFTFTDSTGLPQVLVSQTGGTDFARFVALGTNPKTGFFSSGTSTPLYWNFGMASTLSNAFCLNTSSSSVAPEGGTIVFQASTSGAITKPLQPAFYAKLSSDQTNVTGDGTTYTIICDSEVFDQGNNYNNSTGVFTAPVTGKYRVTATVNWGGLTALFTGGNFQIAVTGTSASTYNLCFLNLGTVRDGSTNQVILSASVLIPMTANDTAILQTAVSGSTKTVTVVGQTSPTTPRTSFSIALEC